MKKYMAFARIYNLRKKDFTNGALLARIEKIIAEAINGFYPVPRASALAGDYVAFSFPCDPSVITLAVPLIVDVNLFWRHPGKDAVMGITKMIKNGIRDAFVTEKIEREDVVVIVRGLHDRDGLIMPLI